MRLLDLFCGAGGSAMGYHRAGFEVVGVDINPMPRYPFEFHQADALAYVAEHGHEFDAIHASPPCQAYSRARKVGKFHPDLIAPTRAALVKTGKPYVIENVELAPLRAQLLLCGTMFDLKTRRHRYFESNVYLGFSPFSCSCSGKASKGYLLNLHNTVQRKRFTARYGYVHVADALRDSIGVEWMDMDTAQEAIPPAYTEFIGAQLMNALVPS